MNPRDFWRERGVPEEALDDLELLAEVVRFNDAKAEEHGKLDAALPLNLDAVMYMAHQRIMRVGMIRTLGPDALKALSKSKPTMIPGTATDIPLETVALLMTWFDGLAAGLEFQRRSDDDERP